MTRDQAELERAWLAECRGVAKGAAIAAGIIALGEWGLRNGTPLCCDCGQTCTSRVTRDGVLRCFPCDDAFLRSGR